MYEISKEFNCCYGHRIHTQELDKKYSINDDCKCRHLHGHQGKIIIYLRSPILTHSMVLDFNMLNWFKKFIDEAIDHKFLISSDDPFLHSFILNKDLDNCDNILIDAVESNYKIVNPKSYKSKLRHDREIYEGLTIVDFVPTAEKFSKWIFDIVTKKMKPFNITVSKVEFYETPKCKSAYIED